MNPKRFLTSIKVGVATASFLICSSLQAQVTTGTENGEWRYIGAVSYTHLTLPPILLV